MTTTNLRELVNILQEKGYRMTAARQIILEVLLAGGGHLTADELAAQVQAREAGIGRMTVYRTLELLSELNIVRPVYQGTGAAHYVLLHDGHHHHLVCSSCHKVIELADCGLAELAEAIGEQFGFFVEGHLVEFYGRCQKCQQAE
ncbi:MAG: Fur family transcriptional regulator [Candidatus Promineifilaceae bacterium]